VALGAYVESMMVSPNEQWIRYQTIVFKSVTVSIKKGDWNHSQVAFRTYEKKMKYNKGLFKIAFICSYPIKGSLRFDWTIHLDIV
jgi:hypothetical protein